MKGLTEYLAQLGTLDYHLLNQHLSRLNWQSMLPLFITRHPRSKEIQCLEEVRLPRMLGNWFKVLTDKPFSSNIMLIPNLGGMLI